MHRYPLIRRFHQSTGYKLTGLGEQKTKAILLIAMLVTTSSTVSGTPTSYALPTTSLS